MSRSDIAQMTDGQREIYYAGVSAGVRLRSDEIVRILTKELSKNNTIKLTNDGLLLAIELVKKS